jgi:hypothetical protein
MYFIPGFLISIVTFPGVIVHELAHQLFCRLCHVAVIEVCYFQPKNPAGYVRHEIPQKASQQILIGIGPFIVNTILGSLIAMPAAIQIIQFVDYSSPFYLFLAWLGISIIMHSFPSITDAKGIWSSVMKKDTNVLLKIIGVPLTGILFVCSLGSVAWLDLIFGFAAAMVIPNVIVHFLA